MPRRSQDIDALLHDWPYQPGVISARLVRAADGREVVQMRVDMGVMQMEVENRPDGEHPGGFLTYLDQLQQLALYEDDEDFQLTEEQCAEVDREFLQYYHRRVCWLALREFPRAVADADHTLALMDFLAGRSPDEEWTQSHEQYRSFVLFHRTQAAALAALENSGAEAAVEEIARGLETIREIFETIEAEEHFDGDELVGQLVELQDWIRNQYHIGRTLVEQLADAVAQEKYELAAQLRDEIAKRRSPRT